MTDWIRNLLASVLAIWFAAFVFWAVRKVWFTRRMVRRGGQPWFDWYFALLFLIYAGAAVSVISMWRR